ncbi:lipopolysaccharide biosynthesis protein [Holdemania filiformis]|uniref:lipopolysaccharide biosynthesis protein n=1 Tax=Holdemania filiformis TaxID=61171 RepID=UPI00242AE124|nr:oligosaccharide flippase family protein [Holdemania filiformis]
MRAESRTKNSLINAITAMAGQGISLIISFVTRIIFIQQLGNVYLGINSLFTNIVGLLSLAELGIGSSINYSLYKPLANKNIEKIKSLMNLYKKVYYAIGTIIMLIGIAMMPFLDFFMKNTETNSVPNLQVIFLLFVLNSAVSYFYSFKRALIISDQKRYIATIYRYAFYILMNFAQIFVLIVTQNFILYLILALLCTIFENLCVSHKANRMYPYLKDRKIEKLKQSDATEIKKNTLALLFHKIGSSVVNSTDNILISKIVGIVVVGIYSNYLLITNALNIVIAQFFTALTASLGNLAVTETTKKSEEIFYEIFFLNFCIVCIISISIFSTIDLLIESWFGYDMILDRGVLICIIINFYLYQIRRTVLTYRDAYGLFWYDRYKALIEAFINLLVSVILGWRIGLIGIFIGTIISTLLTSIWIEPYVLFKYGFNHSGKKYYLTLIIYTIFTALVCMLCESIIKIMNLCGFLGFIIGVIICTLLVSGLIILAFSHTNEFKSLKKKIKKLFYFLKIERKYKNA